MEQLLKPLDERFLSHFLPFFHLAFKYHRYEIKGLENIPKTGSAILVVNHSFATYDGFMLGVAIYLKTGRIPSGLADSNFFKWEFIKNLSHKFRLVEANHSNAERLLREGELLMLAPGGMREALRPTSSERAKVRWEKRLGFAKLAVNTQCPVILAACPSADRIYEIFPNYLTKFFYKNFKLPFVTLKGLGPTLIPRPVKLTHYISRPLIPPEVPDFKNYQECVKSFHGKILREMEVLMNLEDRPWPRIGLYP